MRKKRQSFDESFLNLEYQGTNLNATREEGMKIDGEVYAVSPVSIWGRKSYQKFNTVEVRSNRTMKFTKY